MAKIKPYKNITVADGVDGSITLSDPIQSYKITGTATLTSDWDLNVVGSPAEGYEVDFLYDATVTLGGNDIVILGATMPDKYASKTVHIRAKYQDSAWKVVFIPDMSQSDIIKVDNIPDSEITKAKTAFATTGDFVGTTDTQTLTNKSLEDGSTYLVNTTDNTKKVDTDLSGVTTGKTLTLKFAHTVDREITLPDVTDTLVGETTTNTLTNKTLTSPTVNTPTISGGSISGAVTVDIPDGSLSLNSTAITATAAEINALDGITASTSELNIMDGVTSTTSELNILDGVTATFSEINVLDGATAGTAVANKALVVDANKDITLGTGDITATNITGTLQTATQTNVTGLGTITTGTWNADAIPVAYGGTGAATASAALDNLGAGTVGKAIFQDATAAAVKTELSLDAVENTALSTWTGTTNITTIGTGAVSSADKLSDGVITSTKPLYEVASNITAGIPVVKYIDATKFKALLDTVTNNLFSVNGSDIILEVRLSIATNSTTAANIQIGADSEVRAGADSSDAILSSYAVNSGTEPRGISSMFTNAGTDVEAGPVMAEYDGYITVTSSADISADATFEGSAQLIYIPYGAGTGGAP